jgi:hypothetical protein
MSASAGKGASPLDIVALTFESLQSDRCQRAIEKSGIAFASAGVEPAERSHIRIKGKVSGNCGHPVPLNQRRPFQPRGQFNVRTDKLSFR